MTTLHKMSWYFGYKSSGVIRYTSVVALNMAIGSPEASSAILHHEIRICLVGACGRAARPRSVSQQG